MLRRLFSRLRQALAPASPVPIPLRSEWMQSGPATDWRIHIGRRYDGSWFAFGGQIEGQTLLKMLEGLQAEIAATLTPEGQQKIEEAREYERQYWAERRKQIREGTWP